jgi:hypothetical protein
MLLTRLAKVAPRGRFSRGRFSLPEHTVERIELRSPSNADDVIGVFPCGRDDCDDSVGGRS